MTGDVEPAYTASRVWPASAELALHVADVVRGKRVVELGAGAGLAGLACKVLGAARVVLTDLPENLPLFQRNAARNGLDDVVVAPFDWLTPTTLGERFDVVLAADCVFWPELFEPLLNAIEAVARPDGTVAGHRGHAPARADRRLRGVAPAGGVDGGATRRRTRRDVKFTVLSRRRDAPQNTDVSSRRRSIRARSVKSGGEEEERTIGEGTRRRPTPSAATRRPAAPRAAAAAPAARRVKPRGSTP